MKAENMQHGGKGFDEEACQQSMAHLYRNLSNISVTKIIKKLYEIHGLKALPVAHTDSDGFSFFNKTTSHLLSRFPEFDENCSDKFAAMLSWREIQRNPDRDGAINILKTLKTNLNTKREETTKKHLDWLLRVYGDVDETTARAKDLSNELYITKAIHLECKSRHFVRRKEK